MAKVQIMLRRGDEYENEKTIIIGDIFRNNNQNNNNHSKVMVIGMSSMAKSLNDLNNLNNLLLSSDDLTQVLRLYKKSLGISFDENSQNDLTHSHMADTQELYASNFSVCASAQEEDSIKQEKKRLRILNKSREAYLKTQKYNQYKVDIKNSMGNNKSFVKQHAIYRSNQQHRKY